MVAPMKTHILKKKLPKTASLGDCAYEAIQKHFKKSIKHEEDVLQDDDPEPLHQMRVGMRRLRTALQLFEPAIVIPRGIDQGHIGKIARTLGAVRDLDVLQMTLVQQHYPHLPELEQERLDDLLGQLHKQRQRDFARLEKLLKQAKRYEKFKRAFHQWLQEPEYQAIAHVPILHLLPDLLLPLISQLLLHPGWLVEGKPEDLSSLLQEKGNLLHDLRKQAKRVRYQTEFFLPYYGADYGEHLREFEQIQETLGQIQDATVMADFLAAGLDREVQSALPQLTDRLHWQIQQSWQTWQTLRDRYREPEFRTGVRQAILYPASPVAVD